MRPPASARVACRPSPASRGARALLLAAAVGIGLAPAPPAAAQDASTIYRCLGRDGAERLQDQPCADGETSEMRRIAVPAAAEPATPRVGPAPPPPAASPAPADDAAAVRPTRRVEAPTLPELWECAGVEQAYFSADGRGRSRRVPVWVLEEGRAHAPRAERPGDRRLPPPATELRPAPQAGVLLAPTVDIADQCRLLPVRERCARRGEDGVPSEVAEALDAACGR